MTESLLIRDLLIDCTGRDPRMYAWVRTEGERIAGIGEGALRLGRWRHPDIARPKGGGRH